MADPPRNPELNHFDSNFAKPKQPAAQGQPAASGGASEDARRTLQSFRFNEPPQTVTSPEPTSPVDLRSRKKPAMSRRASSKAMPYRGQEFSVDDASQEVDNDVFLQQRQAQMASGSLRRQPSTIRRRTTAHTTRLPFIESAGTEEEDAMSASQHASRSIHSINEDSNVAQKESPNVEGSLTSNALPEDEEEEGDNDDDAASNADISDSESFTLKDRQEAINETHPFGIRIWKPALYKKDRSVEKDAEGDIHSAPGGHVNHWLLLFNFAWTLIFGWWLALVASVGALLCHVFGFTSSCHEYGQVLWGLARYIFYPFGKYVKIIQEDAYADEDEGEGRSIGEYERWQRGDLEEGRLFFGPVRSLIGRRRRQDDSDDESETTSLLGRSENRASVNANNAKRKRRLFGRGQWNLGRVIFFCVFYGLLTPLLFIVSMICWLLVFTIPMGRVTMILLRHLRKRPLTLEFHSDRTYTRGAGAAPSSIVLCTYRAVGIKYWKYTIDGTNIFLINLLGVVVFVIFDYWILYILLGIRTAITNTILVFLLALFSIIPLAYFIGQAVASISAQSTMGVGAAINAFFSTVVEVFLYCVALNEGKARLVEGSLVGSIFAGILFLPGISMCFGAIKRKTQRFNVRSAGVTSTMLLFAVVGSFGPTLFYQIYGSHEINCHQCEDEHGNPLDRDCRQCFFAQVPAVHDPFFENAVRPYTWFAALLLFLSYVIGLIFTLRTHAATIWNAELDEKRLDKPEAVAHRANQHGAGPTRPAAPDAGFTSSSQVLPPLTPTPAKGDIRESQLYKRILGQSLQQSGYPTLGEAARDDMENKRPENANFERTPSTARLASEAKVHGVERQVGVKVPGLTQDDSQLLVRQMAEMAATAAAVAARDATQNPRRASALARSGGQTSTDRPPEQHRKPSLQATAVEEHTNPVIGEPQVGGHDAPNWGRVKSYTVLLSATLAYAIIAEILVSTVDAVLSNVDIDEKFLGITLFALVPNTTEFLNAISFAMNGNIALSMEIGSAYALQVCLLQIPAVVLFSAVHGRFIDPEDIIDHTFSLIFPQWDMVTVILCVFLLSYMYGEGKSNYFKGSILILSYLVVIVGFYLTGFDNMGTRVMNLTNVGHTAGQMGMVNYRESGLGSIAAVSA